MEWIPITDVKDIDPNANMFGWMEDGEFKFQEGLLFDINEDVILVQLFPEDKDTFWDKPLEERPASSFTHYKII